MESRVRTPILAGSRAIVLTGKFPGPRISFLGSGVDIIAAKVVAGDAGGIRAGYTARDHRALDMSKKLISSRLKDLENAQDYAAWRDVALELDGLEGGDAWKQDVMCEDYDYLLIRERLARMRSGVLIRCVSHR